MRRARALLLVAATIAAGALPAVYGAAADGIHVWIVPAKRAYGLAEEVGFSIVVRNLGLAEARVDFPTSCHTQFEILDPHAGVVYHSAYHYGCLEVLSAVTLAPGEVRTYGWTWDQTDSEGRPVRAGETYTLHAQLFLLGPRPELDIRLVPAVVRLS